LFIYWIFLQFYFSPKNHWRNIYQKQNYWRNCLYIDYMVLYIWILWQIYIYEIRLWYIWAHSCAPTHIFLMDLKETPHFYLPPITFLLTSFVKLLEHMFTIFYFHFYVRSAVLLDVVAVSALIIYGSRVVLGYKQTWDRYQVD
jgi:hypothetical protein